MLQDNSIVPNIFEQYGPIGILAGVMLWLYLMQHKRMRELENKNSENYEKQVQLLIDQHNDQIDAYKSLINDYVNLVGNNTAVIGKLTVCVESFKSTLDEVKEKLRA